MKEEIKRNGQTDRQPDGYCIKPIYSRFTARERVLQKCAKVFRVND